MKKSFHTKNIHTILILSIILVLCISASTFAFVEASSYLASYTTTITAEGSSKILITFDVAATGKMTSIGVTQIEVQKKVGNNWVTDTTLTASNYPNFLTSNSIGHASSVRITGISGTQYRAVLTFYAADSSGSDSKNLTGSTVTCY